MNQATLIAGFQHYMAFPPTIDRGYRSLFANDPTEINDVIEDRLQFCELAASGAGYSRWFLWKHNLNYFIVSCNTEVNPPLSSFSFRNTFLNQNGIFDEIEIEL